MDNTTNSTTYWIAGIIVVLAVILGAWLIVSNNNSVGIPNTGTTDTSQTTTGSGTGY